MQIFVPLCEYQVWLRSAVDKILTHSAADGIN